MEPFSDYKTLLKYGVIKTDYLESVYTNLNPKFELRPYQKEALSFFSYHVEEKNTPYTQLLYHMATGSGKTLIMAANILYLYKEGYKNFIFFVNNINVLEKTKDNFLNRNSSKYLFNEKIVIDSVEVKINVVENFDFGNEEDINIIFTTVQGLHSKLNQPRENSVTYEDFKEVQIVLISDEAHHINAITKSRLNNSEKLELKSWETTVQKILESNSENIMLEYTATAELDHPAIKEKYEGKVLYQYSLKEFRDDGFSKEVEVIQTDSEVMDRALQAVIISQYRKKIAESHRIALKPVILMKSKLIGESEEFKLSFHEMINNLTPQKLQEIEFKSIGIVKKAFEYFKQNNITSENLIIELKEDFHDSKCLSINTKNESEEKQILVNSLEAKNNEIRVVFAVDKLNEGWDVLNLFDIVRLYDTRDTSRRGPGKTTISEAQLIGRGARYFPFKIDDNDPKFKRKYDEDLENELRLLETLYYHSSYNPRYIYELHQALVETGIVPENTYEKDLIVKDNFKESYFWKNGLIFLNDRVQNNMESVNGLQDITIETRYNSRLLTGQTKESAIFDDEIQSHMEIVTRKYKLVDFGKNVIVKAIQKLEFYKFSNIRKYFPHLQSVSEFVTSENFLGSIEIDVKGISDEINNLSQDDKLEIAVDVLKKISKNIKKKTVEFLGTKEFIGYGISDYLIDKRIKIVVNENTDQEYGIGMKETTNPDLYMDLSTKDWYVYNENYGTSEEKYLTKFIDSKINLLQKKFEDIYLIRNERFFQLYRFSDGAALEPDFVLFLKEKDSKFPILYQLFIEAKGEHLIEKDNWKEEFLLEIKQEHRLHLLHQDESFEVYGLPFFNEKINKGEFENKFNEILC